MFQFSTLPPLSLYIHFPWCVQKCPYCDFNSHALGDGVPEQAYVEALLRDLDQDLPLVWGRKVNSIFMGGGTPSLFSAQALEALLSGIRARVALHSNLEVTLEANPGTVEQERFSAYRAIGINRLSIGVQSLSDTHLQSLGRIHNSAEARRAVEAAGRAGFENLNLDLMYGLPQQSVQQALQDLQYAIDLAPTHLSWYQLTLEPNTRFYHDPPSLPGDDVLWQMQESGVALLQHNNFEQYEVSAYAREGKLCRHNLNYWTFGDYLGIGAGAHAKISMGAAQSIKRLSKSRAPKQYMDNAGTPECVTQRQLASEDVVLEFMMNALRLRQGFSIETFTAHTGLDFSLCEAVLSQAQSRGLIETKEQHIRTTETGQRFLNDLLQMFMP
ncbi:MAG: radical SAM family heme chaperone HemW [Gammaproteobacteria bacterium]|nr:radical SAM family heme chaperone HemW [Gammaproteobacteria bacterium]MDH5799418.1 radical SAM family heme chaperone HemW [Gammaproteobacteria bacterium]